MYNVAPTNSDFQLLRGTLGDLPQQGGSGGTPRIGVVGRANAGNNPTYYVWARGYCTGFLTFKADLGCVVNGVETVWLSNIPLNWSMDITCYFGVGTQARRYQFYSGTELIRDHTEVGTASGLGASYRYFGMLAEIRTDSGGTPKIPGSLAAATISDKAPPTVVGSGARMIRTNTSNVNFSANQSQTDFPGNYFDNIFAASSDITVTLATNRFTITKDGWYVMTLGIETTNAPTGRLGLGLKKNNAMWMWGPMIRESNPSYSASWIGYLVAGDYLTPVYANTDGLTAYATRGQGDGQKTSFTIALANRSYA
jgi:hypothetical protein